MRWTPVAAGALTLFLGLACGGALEVPTDDEPTDEAGEGDEADEDEDEADEDEEDEADWDEPSTSGWASEMFRDLRFKVDVPPSMSVRSSGSELVIELGSGDEVSLTSGCDADGARSGLRGDLDDGAIERLDDSVGLVLSPELDRNSCGVVAHAETEGKTWCVQGVGLDPADCLALVAMVRSLEGPPGDGGGGAGRGDRGGGGGRGGRGGGGGGRGGRR